MSKLPDKTCSRGLIGCAQECGYKGSRNSRTDIVKPESVDGCDPTPKPPRACEFRRYVSEEQSLFDTFYSLGLGTTSEHLREKIDFPTTLSAG